MAPKYVLIGNEEKDQEMVSKLKADLEEEQKKAKTAIEDKDKVEAKLRAMDEEDKVEHAKKAMQAALDDEKDETKKEAMKKAMTDIFETGNGTNTNANETDKEKEQTAIIATLTEDAAKPMIAAILVAKKYNGADEKSLKATKEELKKLSYVALKAIHKNDEIYITKALSAATIPKGQSLEATIEAGISFNGEDKFALTGKAIDIDEARGTNQ